MSEIVYNKIIYKCPYKQCDGNLYLKYTSSTGPVLECDKCNEWFRITTVRKWGDLDFRLPRGHPHARDKNRG